MNHRPEHLSCINTAAGIDRINEAQRHYDEDPDRAEAEYAAREEIKRLELTPTPPDALRHGPTAIEIAKAATAYAENLYGKYDCLESKEAEEYNARESAFKAGALFAATTKKE